MLATTNSSYQARQTTRPAGQRPTLPATPQCLATPTSTNKSSRRLRPRTLRTTPSRLRSLPTSIGRSLPTCPMSISRPCRHDTMRLRSAQAALIAAPRRTTTAPLRHTTPRPMLLRRRSDILRITGITAAMTNPMVLALGRHRRPSRLSPQACHIRRSLQQETPRISRPCPPVRRRSPSLALKLSLRLMPLQPTAQGSIRHMALTAAVQALLLILPTLRRHTQPPLRCRHILQVMTPPILLDLGGQTHRAHLHWHHHICSHLDLPG